LRWLLGILLILVVAAGALAVEKYQESCREKEKQELAQRRQQEKQELAQRRRFEKFADKEKVLALLGFRTTPFAPDFDWDTAADSAEAIRLDPQNATLYRGRGYARCVKGEWEPAIADFTEAIRLAPDYARAYALRSIAYAHQGDTEKAQGDRETAKRLGFTPDDFARLAKVLE